MTAPDLARLAPALPGSTVRFEVVSTEEEITLSEPGAVRGRAVLRHLGGAEPLGEERGDSGAPAVAGLPEELQSFYQS